MNAELKYLPIELLSIDKTKLDYDLLQSVLKTYDQHERLPLVCAMASGVLRRYRVMARSEVVLAAQQLKCDAIWVLVLPQQDLPFLIDGPSSNQDLPTETTGTLGNAIAQQKMEEALSFQQALSQGSSQQAVAKTFGVSRSYVNNALQLTKLSPLLESAFLNGDITPSQARILSYEKDLERQRILLQWCSTESVSARKLERAIYHKTDLKTEAIQLRYLASQLSQRWGCPVIFTMSEQGLQVQANPLKVQLSTVIADVSALDIVSNLAWHEQGKAAQLQLSFTVRDSQAFSAWIEDLRLSDAHDLGVAAGDALLALE
jgi:transposase